MTACPRHRRSFYVRSRGEGTAPNMTKDAVVVHNVGGRIRSWGRRGILSGGLLGFVFGAMFVANLPAADIPTFEAICTLMICAIECAVVGGGLGALLAAFNAGRVFVATRPDWRGHRPDRPRLGLAEIVLQFDFAGQGRPLISHALVGLL